MLPAVSPAWLDARHPQRWARLAFWLVLAGILVLTLRPGGDAGRFDPAVPVLCLRCGHFWVEDVIANIVLFLPFGALGVLAGARPSRVALAGAATSFGIEAWQYFVVPGRDATLADFLANSGGSAIGAWGIALVPALLVPSRRLAGRLALGAGLLVVVTAAGAASWLTPVRELGRLHVSVLSDADPRDRADGVVTAVRVLDRSVPLWGAVPEGIPLAAAAARAQLDLAADVSRRPYPTWRTVVARVNDARSDLVTVGSSYRGWWGSVGIHALDLGMHVPSIVLPFAPDDSGPTTLRLRREGGRLQLDAIGPRATHSVVVSLSVLDLWTPLYPFPARLGAWPHPVAVGIAVAFPLLIGWWAGLAMSTGVVVAAALLLALAGAAPVVTAGLAAPPAWGIVVVALSCTLGVALGRRRAAAATASG